MKQNILPTDKDRAKFKARCIELLKPLEEEFDISFQFSSITECYGGTPTARTRMTFQRTKPRVTDVERKDKEQLRWEAARDARFAEYKKDIVISRGIDAYSFSPKVFAIYKGELLFELPLTLIKCDESITHESILAECQRKRGKSHFHEQIAAAFQMMLDATTPSDNLWDSPAAIALTDAVKLDKINNTIKHDND